MTEAEQLNRAARARDLQENTLLTEALDSWEKEITEAWKRSSANDQAARESMFLMLKAAQNFKQFIQTTVETGQIVSARSIHSPTVVEKLKRRF